MEIKISISPEIVNNISYNLTYQKNRSEEILNPCIMEFLEDIMKTVQKQANQNSEELEEMLEALEVYQLKKDVVASKDDASLYENLPEVLKKK